MDNTTNIFDMIGEYMIGDATESATTTSEPLSYEAISKVDSLIHRVENGLHQYTAESANESLNVAERLTAAHKNGMCSGILSILYDMKSNETVDTNDCLALCEALSTLYTTVEESQVATESLMSTMTNIATQNSNTEEVVGFAKGIYDKAFYQTESVLRLS